MYSPTYNEGFTNHLPMVITSMERLGFTRERMNEVIEIYSTRLEQAEATEYGRRYIELREKMSNVDVKEYLSDKLSTIPSALFHHFIRLYFSIGDKELEKSALAYFELAKHDFKVEFDETSNITEHIEKLIKRRIVSPVNFLSGSSMDKYRAIRNSSLKEYLKVPNYVDIKEMTNLFLDMFSRTKDFYILHVITGFQAILGLKDYLDVNEAVKEYYKHAQIFIILGDTFGPRLPNAKHELEYYIKKAPSLEDAHDIKLLYSLTELKKVTDSPLIEDIAEYIIKG